MKGEFLQNNRCRRGFTLVEVIVVLVILAILAAIMIPAMTGWIDKAKEKRVIVACRTCALAAQTLASENYAVKGALANTPTDGEIRALAGIDKGTCSSVIVAEGKLIYLKYEDDTEYAIYMSTDNGTRYLYNDTPPEWATGQTYTVGGVMSSNGYVFECIRANTTGTTSRTRNPSLRSNKSTWQVIGYTDEPLQYSSTVRYAVGVAVEYKGGMYVRKDFNLVGGQVPYEKKDSDYWLYAGPATTTP